MNDFEDALATLAVEDDVFGANNFDAAAYLNKKFPHERATAKNDSGGIDTLLVQLQKEEEEVCLALTSAMRESFNQNKMPIQLQQLKSDLDLLSDELRDIEERATKTHSHVEHVSRDIKSLDRAKYNITMTVTRLKRFVMLVQALEQLRTYAHNRQYKQVANLLLACEHLANDFTDLVDKVAKVAQLWDQKSQLMMNLRHQLLDDYDTILEGRLIPPSLIDANESVDAMKMREEVLTKFCLNLLEEYKRIFQPPSEASSLDMMEKRFSWLSRKLREYEEKYTVYFPKEWNGQQSLCEHFCHITKQHLVELLTSAPSDPDVLVKMLRRSMQFETDLEQRYNNEQFKGIISDSFDHFLGPWVRQEENLLVDVFRDGNNDEVLTADIGHKVSMDNGLDDGDDSSLTVEPKNVYASASSLFVQMQATFKRWQSFNKPQTLKDVFTSFKKVFQQYCIALEGRIPEKGPNTTGLTLEVAEIICAVFGTCDYVSNALPSLQQMFESTVVTDATSQQRTSSQSQRGAASRAMSSAHSAGASGVIGGRGAGAGGLESRRTSGKSKSSDLSAIIEQSIFSLDDTADLFGGLMSKAVQGLISHAEVHIVPLFKNMLTQEVSETTDESELEVSDKGMEVHASVKDVFQIVSSQLNVLHFHFFLASFSDWFIPQYVKEIYQGRNITVPLAQQMLFDTLSFKAVLNNLPPHFTNVPVPRAYENMVNKKIEQAELVFQVLCGEAVDLPDDQLQRIQSLTADRMSVPPSPKSAEQNLKAPMTGADIAKKSKTMFTTSLDNLAKDAKKQLFGADKKGWLSSFSKPKKDKS